MMVADIAASPLWQKGGARVETACVPAGRPCSFQRPPRTGYLCHLFRRAATATGDADLEVIAHATRLASVAVRRW